MIKNMALTVRRWGLDRYWMGFLSFALLAGTLLRLLYVEDMEYKEDEEYNFNQSQLIADGKVWPWYGIPSGVYLVNPGMSIWVFAGLAKLFGLRHPTSLAHGVQLFALFGIFLVIPLAIRWVVDLKERKLWYWAFALAMVNPFLVFYQRKLWPEPFLPCFTLLTLMGWFSRKTRIGALVWGMVGAWLGQVHMSGFFFSAALFLWTLFFDRRRDSTLKVTEWRYWFLGSVIGALPLIPWLIFLYQHPIHQSMSGGWNEIVQLKYWAFWFTDPTGLHLGNPLGINRGPTHWDQISDFVRYPLFGSSGQASYAVGVAHAILLSCVVGIFLRGLRSLWLSRRNWVGQAIGRGSETAFVQNAAFWGCGILLTVTGVMIRRYYMTVTFPLEFILFARMAGPDSRVGRNLLMVAWIAQLFISANFVGYIHVNEGSSTGDYGQAYHLIRR